MEAADDAAVAEASGKGSPGVVSPVGSADAMVEIGHAENQRRRPKSFERFSLPVFANGFHLDGQLCLKLCQTRHFILAGLRVRQGLKPGLRR